MARILEHLSICLNLVSSELRIRTDPRIKNKKISCPNEIRCFVYILSFLNFDVPQFTTRPLERG